MYFDSMSALSFHFPSNSRDGQQWRRRTGPPPPPPPLWLRIVQVERLPATERRNRLPSWSGRHGGSWWKRAGPSYSSNGTNRPENSCCWVSQYRRHSGKFWGSRPPKSHSILMNVLVRYVVTINFVKNHKSELIIFDACLNTNLLYLWKMAELGFSNRGTSTFLSVKCSTRIKSHDTAPSNRRNSQRFCANPAICPSQNGAALQSQAPPRPRG